MNIETLLLSLLDQCEQRTVVRRPEVPATFARAVRADGLVLV